MSGRRVWYNQVERDAWVEKNCRVCFQPDEAMLRITGKGVGCPHKARGDAGKLPKPWTYRRTAVMGETYHCSEFQKQPPTNRRGKARPQTRPACSTPSPRTTG